MSAQRVLCRAHAQPLRTLRPSAPAESPVRGTVNATGEYALIDPNVRSACTLPGICSTAANPTSIRACGISCTPPCKRGGRVYIDRPRTPAQRLLRRAHAQPLRTLRPPAPEESPVRGAVSVAGVYALVSRAAGRIRLGRRGGRVYIDRPRTSAQRVLCRAHAQQLRTLRPSAPEESPVRGAVSVAVVYALVSRAAGRVWLGRRGGRVYIDRPRTSAQRVLCRAHAQPLRTLRSSAPAEPPVRRAVSVAGVYALVSRAAGRVRLGRRGGRVYIDRPQASAQRVLRRAHAQPLRTLRPSAPAESPVRRAVKAAGAYVLVSRAAGRVWLRRRGGCVYADRPRTSAQRVLCRAQAQPLRTLRPSAPAESPVRGTVNATGEYALIDPNVRSACTSPSICSTAANPTSIRA